MTCSIIIVNYNTQDLLRQLLNSIAQYFYGVEFEVIVVDNASTDGSEKLIEEFAGRLPLIWLSSNTNAGFAIANNQAIKQAQGKFVLLLNSDTVLIDSTLVQLIHKTEKMPDVAVAGCKLLNQDRTLQRSCGTRPNLRTEIYNKLLLDRLWRIVPALDGYYLPLQAYDHFQETDWVTGACMLVRRDVLDQIGLLDENIYMYYEDVDICLRVKQAGYRVIYSPVASVVHLRRGSSHKTFDKAIRDEAQSMLYFHKKHSNMVMVYFLRVLLVIQNFLRICFLVPAALISPSSRRDRRQRLKGYAYAMGQALLPIRKTKTS